MVTRLRVLGMPLHPALVHFPLALLLASAFWDVIGASGDPPFWRAFAFWTMLAGLVAAVPTVVTGLLDYAALPRGSARRTARLHMALNFGALAAFALSFVLRLGDGAVTRPEAALVFALIGALLLVGGAALGGALVFLQGAGRADMERGRSTFARLRPPGHREATRSA